MIKQNYSSIKPSFNLDFINTDILDSRVNFQRSCPAAYHDGAFTTVGSNMLSFSQDISGADWRKSNVTVMSNVSAAPDGTQTADKVAINSDFSSGNTFISPELDGTVVTGIDHTGEYTFSFYVKSAGHDYLKFQIYDQSSGADGSSRKHRAGTWINLQSGELYANESELHKWNHNNSKIDLIKLHNGWYRLTVTFTRLQNDGTVNYWIYPSVDGKDTKLTSDGESGVLVWGCQLEQGGHVTDYIKTNHSPAHVAQSTLKFAAADQPRFDHDPITGDPRGLLIEEARSNLMPDFRGESGRVTTKGDWNPYGKMYGSRIYVKTNNTVAPDGTYTGTTIHYDGTISTPYHYVHALTTLETNREYTFSVYVKLPVDADKRMIDGVRLHLHSNISVNNAFTTFNLIEGTKESGAGTIESVGNGWYRVSVTGNTRMDDDTAYTDTDWCFGIYPALEGVTSDQIGTETLHEQNEDMPLFHMWAPQVEGGGYPTSYIKTDATRWAQLNSSFTREADTITITGENLSSWFRSDQGTIFCEANLLPTSGNSGRAVYNFQLADNNPQYAMAFSKDGTATYHYFNSGDVNEYKHYMDTSSNDYKACFSYSYNNIISFVNGVENLKLRDGTPRNFVEMFDPEVLSLGGISTSTGNFIRGWIKQFKFYPQQLTDTQTQILTK